MTVGGGSIPLYGESTKQKKMCINMETATSKTVRMVEFTTTGLGW